MIEIAKNVFSEDRFSFETGKPGDYRGCNPSYVVTSEGIVTIDSPRLPTDAIKMRNEIVSKGTLRYVINTDSHLDHSGGNFFMPGSVVVSSQGVRDTLLGLEADGGVAKRVMVAVRKDDPGGEPLMEGYKIKPPTITFTEKLNLYVGEYKFELRHLPGHSEPHIGVYLPNARVFFAGDNFCNLTQPNLAYSLPLEWVESLKKIEALDVDVIVSGHGSLCRDPKEVGRFRAFLEQCIEIIRGAIKKGLTKEEAAATISFENLYPGPGRGCPVHPGPETQRANVLRFYDMLSYQSKRTI